MRIAVRTARRHLIPSEPSETVTMTGDGGAMMLMSQALDRAVSAGRSEGCATSTPFAVPPYAEARQELRYQYRRMRNEKRAEAELAKHVVELEQNLMPHILPNRLYLSETTVHGPHTPPPSAHGFQISTNAGGGPLLVGFRYGSRWKNKVEDISLCLGEEWYGSAYGPFFRATSHGQSGLTFKFVYRSPAPNKIGRKVRMGLAKKSALGTIFSFKVPDLADNTLATQEFEWRHRGVQRLKGSNYSKKGVSILVQKSINQAVACMCWGHKSGKALTGDFAIEFLGAGQTYGGTWKLVSFMVGIMGYHRTQKTWIESWM